MIAIDTTVFLLAAGPAHAMREAAQATIMACAEDRLTGVVTTEVVQDLLHLGAWHQRRREAMALVRHVQCLFPDPIPVDAKDLETVLGYLERRPGLSIRVAVHAAALQRVGVKTVITTDPEFGLIHGLRWQEPVK
jgi:predicted nucleic acid-binding protein